MQSKELENILANKQMIESLGKTLPSDKLEAIKVVLEKIVQLLDQFAIPKPEMADAQTETESVKEFQEVEVQTEENEGAEVTLPAALAAGAVGGAVAPPGSILLVILNIKSQFSVWKPQ